VDLHQKEEKSATKHSHDLHLRKGKIAAYREEFCDSSFVDFHQKGEIWYNAF
jgi:hypothetical protein